MKTIAIIAVAAALASLYLVSGPSDDNDGQFTQFMNEYGKSYNTEAELEFRKSIFAENMKKAEIYQAENPLAEFGVTIFSDRTAAEMTQMMGAAPIEQLLEDLPLATYDDNLSVLGIDWRNYLPPVQNQGQCGSCWAFAGTATFEGRRNIAGRGLNKFSEQQIVDCVTKSYGCKGGWSEHVFQYTMSTLFCSLSFYPYNAKDGTCYSNTCGRDSNTGAWLVPENEPALLYNLQTGPIAIAVNADTWGSYKSGVLTSCGTSITHYVTLVGFESWNNAWIVRNSWGSWWGEAGHIRLAYGGNVCNLTRRATFPSF